MNMLFIKHFFVVFMVSEIPRVSVFGYFPLNTLTFGVPYTVRSKGSLDEYFTPKNPMILAWGSLES